MNNKKDYCVKKAFADLHKARLSLNDRLSHIQQTARQNRIQREQYEITERLLQLMSGRNNNNNNEDELKRHGWILS